MPAVPRELSIVYGTTTVGGSSDTLLLDYPLEVDEGPDAASVTFPLTFRAASEAAFDTGISDLETAFRTPRQRLRIIQGSATLYDWDPATNSGFNHEPEIQKIGDDTLDSGRSRRYRVTVRIGMPADTYSQSGRRHARVVVERSPARRRTLTLAGEWTALSGSSARVSYEAGVAAYAASIIGALGGTYELAAERVDEDETNKILSWSRTYEEVIFGQSTGGLDHSAIVNQALLVSVRRTHPGDSPIEDTSRLLEISVSYSAWIDRDVSTDLDGIYRGTIRPWLIQTAFARAGASAGALVDETPTYDGPENRVSATLTILASDGGTVLEYRETTEINDQDLGTVIVPVWNGNRYAAHIYSGIAIRLRTVTIERRDLSSQALGRGGGNVGIDPQGADLGGVRGGGGNVGIADLGGARLGPRRGPGGGGGGGGGDLDWIQIAEMKRTTPLRIGPNDNPLDVVDTFHARTWRWVHIVGGGRPGEGGGPVITEDTSDAIEGVGEGGGGF